MLNNRDRLQLRQKRMAQSPPIFRGGFRPFFIGAAFWAICALAVWLLILFGHAPTLYFDDPLAWHRHEMLFGFVGSAIAGFALTAVPNWTGRLPIAGGPLAILFAIWLAGRILPFVVTYDNLLLIIVDPGFYIALAALLAREILKSRNRNLPIVGVICLFGIADLIDRAAMADLIDAGNFGWRSGFALVIFLIAIIGGRIVPSFTRNWLVAQGAAEPLPTQPDSFDKAVLLLTVLALLSWLIGAAPYLTGIAVAGVAIAHVLRLLRWQGWKCHSNPLLIILHIGYLWLPIGLFLLAFARWHLVPETAGIHALATGAMATMILAVMSRASLGHTGRELTASSLMIISYVLINVAAAMRVLAAIGVGDQQILLMVAALAWFGAFGLFLLQFIPILMTGPIEKEVERRS